MKKFLYSCLSLLMLTGLLAGCSDNDDTSAPFLEIETPAANFLAEASSQPVVVKTNIEGWTAAVPAEAQSWCTATPTRSGKAHQLLVSVTENPDMKLRSTDILVSAEGAQSITVKVQQMGQEPAILLAPDKATLKNIGGDIEVEVTSNVEFTVAPQADWITVVPQNKAAEMVTSTHKFRIARYNGNEIRQSEILFRPVDAQIDLQAAFLIVQKGDEGYEADQPEGIVDDIRVPVASGNASSFQAGSGIEKSFDGDMNTLYHSNWSNSGQNYFPITLTYNFQNQESIDYFIYYPRQSGYNGHFGLVEIQTATEENPAFTTYKEIDFGKSATATRIKFDQPLVKPTGIRLIVKTGNGDGQGFAACAEMEFYRKNPEQFDPLTLFTDQTCSELKPGITEADIEACEYAFFRNIAYYMFQGKYPDEFRIQEYKPYPVPEMFSEPNKTSTYSLLDNPTGICVNQGDELIILVGETGDEKLGLKIQDLDQPGKDGYGDGSSSYALLPGINKISARNKGLLYVLYNTRNYETARPVKIHIASGRVNGYYDVARHQPADWQRLLGAAVDTHFDLVGEYAHCTFPVAKFRAQTPDGAALIGVYDDIVRMEQEFMGLKKYDRMNKNRVYLHVVYNDAYMYATSYHTGYVIGTMDELCNVQTLKTSAIWGPAHEIGHVNQTRPGLRWLGTTEVTNNIHSLYIQTSFGNASRLQQESMSGEGFTNRYEKAMTQIFSTGMSHAAHEDVFCKLVPFWQLQLYLSNVLGKTEFYTDVYETVRTTPNLPTAGEQQLEFAYTCSRIAGLNLIDFFERWGFFTPVDRELDDYGTAKFTVTQAQADAVKERIRQLGLPEPEDRFEYICDENTDVYKTHAQAATPGTAVRSGEKLTMRGWKNVAAYEVYDASGDLIFVSSEPSFTIKQPWANGFKAYAVAPSGHKTEVTF